MSPTVAAAKREKEEEIDDDPPPNRSSSLSPTAAAKREVKEEIEAEEIDPPPNRSSLSSPTVAAKREREEEIDGGKRWFGWLRSPRLGPGGGVDGGDLGFVFGTVNVVGFIRFVDLCLKLLNDFLDRGFLAFPLHGGVSSSWLTEIIQGSKIFKLYVVVGTTVGLFLLLAYVLGSFGRGDDNAVRSATPHLFLLSFQILTENVSNPIHCEESLRHSRLANSESLDDVILYRVKWFGQNYEGGESEMIFVPRDLTYDGLMNTIEDIVRIDSSSCNIELRAVMSTRERCAIPRIKNDRDVAFLMCEERVIPKEYVTTVGRDQTVGGNM
ncbi:hypothetical protein EZV62_015487 [Acer yangbiense]|uniref:DUF7733 domain-containing protein n=1 Tax=Acer yangbiense TaxID=1000413 RepID=A0A5C7HLB4_9ROSI|nr:hypothetical protein EZV62_015487 [Acer yangbiense]